MMQHKLRVPPPLQGQLEGGFSKYTPQQVSAKELFWGDGGKAHYPPTRSETYQFKPGRAKLYPGKSDYEKPGGLKSLPIPQPVVLPRAQQRHQIPAPFCENSQQRSGYDVPERSIEAALNRKNMVVRDNGFLARDYVSKEVTLDVSFGVKRKMGDGIRTQRNGIPVANPVSGRED